MKKRYVRCDGCGYKLSVESGYIADCVYRIEIVVDDDVVMEFKSCYDCMEGFVDVGENYFDPVKKEK